MFKKHIYIILILLALSCDGKAVDSGAMSNDGALSADNIDQSIENVISRPEYSWRMPRERPERPDLKLGFLQTFFHRIFDWFTASVKWMGKYLKQVIEWLKTFLDRDEPARRTGINWQVPLQVLLFTLLLITGSLLAIQVYRLWHNRATTEAVAEAVKALPDLLDENISADELPSDEWMKMAADMLNKGELRLALRAMFLGSLAELARSRHITVAMSKSNREYTMELRRRAHDRPDMLNAFESNVLILERTWYGTHYATVDMVSEFESNQTRILHETENI